MDNQNTDNGNYSGDLEQVLILVLMDNQNTYATALVLAIFAMS